MHLNKVVVIQSPVMVDINNSRSWRVKFYTDTGSSWTTVFPGGGGIKLIILHGKKILWDKIGETAVKWISVAKIGEQWARKWVKSSFSCNSKLSFKFLLEICQNIPQDLRCFKKSLYFQSIYTLEISPKWRSWPMHVLVPFSHLVLPRYFACCLLAERDAFALLVEKYWELISRKSDMAS